MPATPNFFLMTIFAVIFWLFFFVRQTSTRTEMLALGVLSALLAPVFSLLSGTSLATVSTSGIEIGVLDIIFSFCFGGIAAVIFQEVLGKRYRTRIPLPLKRIRLNQSWFLHLFLLFVLWAWLAVFFTLAVGVAAWQGVIVSGIFLGSYVIVLRHDLLIDAVLSGVLMTVVLFSLYELSFFREGADIATPWWGSTSTGAHLLMSVPLQALLWAATVGFVLGPLYEFARNLNLKTPK